jgi:hypothetical protein
MSSTQNLKYSKHFKPLTGSSFGREVEIPTWWKCYLSSNSIWRMLLKRLGEIKVGWKL